MEWIPTVGVFIIAMGLCHLAMMWMMGGHGHGNHTASQADPRVVELEEEVSALRRTLVEQRTETSDGRDDQRVDTVLNDAEPDGGYVSPFDGTRRAL